MRVAALVTYDGTDYSGFQFQKDEPTIQGTLEDALFRLTNVRCRIQASGRTDRGVHARGQVISLALSWQHGESALQRAWNAHLPRSIAIQKLCSVSERFHPRFSARSRTYRYFIHLMCEPTGNTPAYSPLADRFALTLTHSLDIEAMQRAARYLIGAKDFASFGQPPQGTNTVREVLQANWQVVTNNLHPLQKTSSSQLVFTIAANAFLRRMVRNVTGSLIEVGRGRWTVDHFINVLGARDRSMSAPPVPPNGLVLEYVDYPNYPDLFP